MDEKRPYEDLDPYFSSLPLPDENKAWEQMKAKLEEEEDDRFFFLPFLQGCGGWALLLLLLLAGGVWWYRHTTTTPKSSAGTRMQDTINRQVKTAPGATGGPGAVLPNSIPPVQEHTNINTAKNTDKENNNTTVARNERSNSSAGSPTDKRKPGQQNMSGRKNRTDASTVRAGVKATLTNRTTPTTNEMPVASNEPSQSLEQVLITQHGNLLLQKDSVNNKVDTAAKQQPAVDSALTPPLQKVAQSKRYRLGAGMALQQQLPLGGQQWTPYNYMGRKGSWADYVPSLYLRLYKEQQWFLQTEFRYGAPQYTREFVYQKTFKTDSAGRVQASTAYRLKKTYYHQLPVSFHYQVKPDWSIGTGVVYNRFYGAVSEKEERAQLTPAADTLVSKAMVRDKNDSLFRSSNLQLLLETQYRWKRLSVGVRFTQGLQPFIEYTDAQGQKQQQKNHAFKLFVRYELWRQKQ